MNRKKPDGQRGNNGENDKPIGMLIMVSFCFGFSISIMKVVFVFLRGN